jgi:hypothetical protein
MKRVAFLVLFLVVASFGAENWNGWLDTSNVQNFRADSTKYSKAFDLGRYENTAVVVKVRDTSTAGFGADSIQLRYGYQVGTPTLDSAGNIDTLWEPVVWLDTMRTDSLGKLPEGYTDSNLDGYRNSGWVDTLKVTGWAAQACGVSAEWRPLIRYVLNGLTGNNGDSMLIVQIHHVRRLTLKTHGG